MAFMYMYPTSPDWDPYPMTYVHNTWPEKAHPHHVPLPYLVHKAGKALHDKDNNIHRPTADIRETPSTFYIDIDLPGLTHKSDLHINWTSTRTLLVSTRIERPPIEEGDSVEVATLSSHDPQDKKIDEPSAKHAPNGDEAEKHASGPGSKNEPHLTVNERQIGFAARAFNFPVDVNRDHTTAKLGAGLLRIQVHKEQDEKALHQPVAVTVH